MTSGCGIFAQKQLDRAFFGFHGVKAGKPPADDRHQNRKANCSTGQSRTTAATARTTSAGAVVATTSAHQDAQLFLALFDQFVDFGHLPAAFAGATTATGFAAIACTVGAAIAPASVISARASAAPRAACVASHMFSVLLFATRGGRASNH